MIIFSYSTLRIDSQRHLYIWFFKVNFQISFEFLIPVIWWKVCTALFTYEIFSSTVSHLLSWYFSTLHGRSSVLILTLQLFQSVHHIFYYSTKYSVAYINSVSNSIRKDPYPCLLYQTTGVGVSFKNSRVVELVPALFFYTELVPVTVIVQ